jgi:hypothetical protein
VSYEGKLLAHDAHHEAAKKVQVADLRQRYLEGRLNTPEHVERAASKMLGGS